MDGETEENGDGEEPYAEVIATNDRSVSLAKAESELSRGGVAGKPCCRVGVSLDGETLPVNADWFASRRKRAWLQGCIPPNASGFFLRRVHPGLSFSGLRTASSQDEMRWAGGATRTFGSCHVDDDGRLRDNE